MPTMECLLLETTATDIWKYVQAHEYIKHKLYGLLSDNKSLI